MINSIAPLGEHEYDPLNKDIDPLAYALGRLQVHLLWIDEHRASYEASRSSDPETAEVELEYLKSSTKDALIHLKRLSELILAGVTVDSKKRIPEFLHRDMFNNHVDNIIKDIKEQSIS